MIAAVRNLCLKSLISWLGWNSSSISSSPFPFPSVPGNASPLRFLTGGWSPAWKTLSRQFRQGWTWRGYASRTFRTMASWPKAIKREVEGYIAIMFAPTCAKETLDSPQRTCSRECTRLGAKGEITKYRDHLISDTSRPDPRANHNIHPTLAVGRQFVVDRVQLAGKSIAFSEIGTGK